MIEQHSGIIEFDYEGRQIVIPYVMDYLGGVVNIYFTDKKGKYHHFFYRSMSNRWVSRYGQKITWPYDFVIAMFDAFDAHRKKHGY